MKRIYGISAKRLAMALGVALMGFSLFMSTPAAQAIGPTGPDPNDFSPTTRRIELVVSRTTDVNNPTSLVKLYFNQPSGSFRIEDYRLCKDSPGTAGNYYDIDASAAAGANATRYDVYNSQHTYNGNVEEETIGGLIGSTNGIASAIADCKTYSTTMNVSGLDYSQDVGKYVAYLRATNLINGTQNSFRVVTTTNGYAIGYDSTIAASQFGINQVDPLSGYTDYLLKFAGDCTLTSARTEELQWYDDDNGTAGIQPTPMRFQLRKYPVAGGAYSLQPFTSIKKTNGDSISWSQSGGWYTAYSGSKSTVAAQFTAEPGYRYIWYWDNVYYNNTLQFKLAFDSIFFNTGCQRPPDFNLTPSIGMQINGTSASGNDVAQVGDTVRFTYRVGNSGNDPSGSTNCTIYGKKWNGSHTMPSGGETGSDAGYSPPSTGCPRSFPGRSNTQLATEDYTVTSADVNRTVCRSLFVDPFEAGGGSRGTGVCFRVAAKPYVKVFGGDVSAGNGIITSGSTCSPNSNGGITAWNRESAGGFAGAGTHYAAMALAAINDFASAQDVGGASPPSNLAFANQTTSASLFGGSLGSLPCIPNYYDSAKVAAAQPAPSSPLGGAQLSSMNGSYSTTTNLTISGGNINPGQKVVLYVQGNVYINGNITYPGNWSYNNIPLFQLIVKGNIYIDGNVTQLDGAYIAQPNMPTAAGTIATCSSSTGPYPLDGALYSRCDQKLTVNGLLSAAQVMLMRTYGTISQSTVGEGTGGFGGEVINYNPTLWIAQPPTPSGSSTGSAGTYDAITSLPPVL